MLLLVIDEGLLKSGAAVAAEAKVSEKDPTANSQELGLLMKLLGNPRGGLCDVY